MNTAAEWRCVGTLGLNGRHGRCRMRTQGICRGNGARWRVVRVAQCIRGAGRVVSPGAGATNGMALCVPAMASTNAPPKAAHRSPCRVLRQMVWRRQARGRSLGPAGAQCCPASGPRRTRRTTIRRCPADVWLLQAKPVPAQWHIRIFGGPDSPPGPCRIGTSLNSCAQPVHRHNILVPRRKCVRAAEKYRKRVSFAGSWRVTRPRERICHTFRRVATRSKRSGSAQIQCNPCNRLICRVHPCMELRFPDRVCCTAHTAAAPAFGIPEGHGMDHVGPARRA